MLDLLIAAFILLIMFYALLVTIKTITKETEKQNKDNQEKDGLNPIQALHCIESFNLPENSLNILSQCIKVLDDSSLSELEGHNLKYTKNTETNKIEFKKV